MMITLPVLCHVKVLTDAYSMTCHQISVKLGDLVLCEKDKGIDTDLLHATLNM